MKNLLIKHYYYSIDKPIEVCINRIANHFCHDTKYKGVVNANSFSFRKKHIELFTLSIKDRVRYKVYGEFYKYNNTTILKITISFINDLIPLLLISSLMLVFVILEIIKQKTISNLNLFEILITIAGVLLFIYFIRKAGYDFINEAEFALEKPIKISNVKMFQQTAYNKA